MLTYRYETLEEVCERAGKRGKSVGETEHILDSAASKGVIGHRKRGGTKQYACGTCVERCQTGAMKLNDEGRLPWSMSTDASDAVFALRYVPPVRSGCGGKKRKQFLHPPEKK